MSYQALNWAVKQRIGTPVGKGIVMAIANYADEKGTCFPSHERLARETELSDKSVRVHLKRLEDLGVLTTERKRDDAGRHGLIRYCLALDRSFDIAAEDTRGSRKEKKLPQDAAVNGEETLENGTPVVQRYGAPLEPAAGQVETPPVSGGTESLSKRTKDSRENARAREERPVPEVEPKLTVEFLPPTDEPQNDPLFGEALRRYDPGAIDVVAEAWAAWQDFVPLDERQAAVDAMPRYLRGRKDVRRSTVPALKNYFRNGDWRRFPQPAGATTAEPSIELKPFCVPLWALLWGVIDPAGRSHAAPSRVEYFLGRMDKGLVTPSGAVPDDSATEGLVAVVLDSPEHVAWVRHCERLGFRLPRPDAVPVVYVPSLMPPVLKPGWKTYRLARPMTCAFRSRSWWWRVHQIEDGAVLDAQLREGGRGHGNLQVEMGPWPAIADLADMVEVRRGAPNYEQWTTWFAAKGAQLDLWPDEVIWCPSEWPPAAMSAAKMREGEAA